VLNQNQSIQSGLKLKLLNACRQAVVLKLYIVFNFGLKPNPLCFAETTA